MLSRKQWSNAFGLFGTILIGVGGWFGYRDHCDRQGVTVEVAGVTELQLTTDVEHAAAFILRNNSFLPAKLVSGEPG